VTLHGLVSRFKRQSRTLAQLMLPFQSVLRPKKASLITPFLSPWCRSFIAHARTGYQPELR